MSINDTIIQVVCIIVIVKSDLINVEIRKTQMKRNFCSKWNTTTMLPQVVGSLSDVHFPSHYNANKCHELKMLVKQLKKLSSLIISESIR